MLQFLKKKNSDVDNNEKNTKDIDSDTILSLKDAIAFVDNKLLSYDKMSVSEKHDLQSQAMSGDINSRNTLKNIIKEIIVENRIKVDGYKVDELVDIIYADKYGLDILEKYYENSNVDEIRVNNEKNIRIVKKGIPYRINEKFSSDRDVEKIIKRMIIEDVGVPFDKSNPIVESVLKDGSRLTAVCHPVAKTWNFTLRKHDSFEMTLENYIKVGTLDEYVWNVLSILAKGGAKMLFAGNVGAGKTTLMKKVIGEVDEKLRIGVLGTDIELNLSEYYPDRDIIEFEEQPHLGITMRKLFSTMLRESIDVLVIEEFRGSGEAIEAVRACTRGMPNAFSTAHFNSPEEAVEGTALFMLEEGLNLDLDLAKLRVARAFNIIVQLFGDAISGKKKLISITEVGVDKDNKIFFNDLVKWVPQGDDYLGEGNWIKVNQPSSNMLRNILKRLSRKEVEKLGWDTSEINF